MGDSCEAPQSTPRRRQALDSSRENRRTPRPQATMNQEYIDTVRLMLAIAPAVFRSPRFALKGGTALNLFVQDMPRLSIDIDVVFTDHTLDREAALKAIAAELKSIKSAISAMGHRAVLPTTKSGDEVKLVIA